jgi:tetratricopeptide (TPR) repeat protein
LIQATDDASIDEGLEELRAAIQIDPAFGLPYADISDALVQKIFYALERPPELIGEARMAALSAVALAPSSAEAHTALAGIYAYFDFDWAASEQAYEDAIALQPNSPVPYHRYTDFLWVTLRLDRAVEMAKMAVELDPLDSSSMHAVGLAYLTAGQYDNSVRAFADWNRFHPQSKWSYVKYALALSLNGQCDIAMERLSVVRQLTKNNRSMLMESWMLLSYYLCGEDDLHDQSVKRMERDLAADGVGDPPALVWLRLVQGDIDGVVEILQHAVDTKSVIVPFMRLYSLEAFGMESSKVLGRDTRYIELIKEIGFPATIQP